MDTLPVWKLISIAALYRKWFFLQYMNRPYVNDKSLFVSGPWDNKSSRLLIELLGEYPKAYFILDKECKRTEAWEIIRFKLAEAGYQFTVLQVMLVLLAPYLLDPHHFLTS